MKNVCMAFLLHKGASAGAFYIASELSAFIILINIITYYHANSLGRVGLHLGLNAG